MTPARRSHADPVFVGSFRAGPLLMAREHSSVLVSAARIRGRRRTFDPEPEGKCQPVLLIPGFMSGDWSMSPLARTLRSWNFLPERSDLRLNVDCTATTCDHLERRLAAIAAHHRKRVAIVGWSRGGTLGKLLVLRRPDLVSGLITLASPNHDPLAVNTFLAHQLNLLVRAQAAGLQGVLGADCIHGVCAEAMAQELAGPYPADIPYVSIYVPGDGVVNWQACLDPDATLIEIHSTHMAVGYEPRVHRLVGEELSRLPLTNL